MMTLFRYELKKIWHPPLVLTLLAFGLLYYFLLPATYIHQFRYGSDRAASFEISSEWILRYGTSVDAEERKDLEIQLSWEIEQFNTSLADLPPSLTLGIDNYESFMEFQEAHFVASTRDKGRGDMEQERRIWQIIEATPFFRIQAIKRFMEFYDHNVSIVAQGVPPSPEYPSALRSRILKLRRSPRFFGYLPVSVMEASVNYFRSLAIWLVFSTVFFLSPTLVRDRLYRTRAMQCSSRTGRGLLSIQQTAALFSALLFFLLNLTFYLYLFLRMQPLHFAKLGVLSVWQPVSSWVDWTYGGYLLFLIACLFLLCLITAMLTIFFSRYSKNYTELILRMIPLCILLGGFYASWSFYFPLFFRKLHPSSDIWLFQRIEPFSLLLLLCAALFLSKRMRKQAQSAEETS
ncbi:MAG: hypothetical protein Q4A78_10160 [Peptostreptococcaceae bacterium]|nr:hypothetical protein [Peptostreptococcaceae bacterium]